MFINISCLQQFNSYLKNCGTLDQMPLPGLYFLYIRVLIREQGICQTPGLTGILDIKGPLDYTAIAKKM